MFVTILISLQRWDAWIMQQSHQKGKETRICFILMDFPSLNPIVLIPSSSFPRSTFLFFSFLFKVSWLLNTPCTANFKPYLFVISVCAQSNFLAYSISPIFTALKKAKMPVSREKITSMTLINFLWTILKHFNWHNTLFPHLLSALCSWSWAWTGFTCMCNCFWTQGLE